MTTRVRVINDGPGSVEVLRQDDSSIKYEPEVVPPGATSKEHSYVHPGMTVVVSEHREEDARG